MKQNPRLSYAQGQNLFHKLPFIKKLLNIVIYRCIIASLFFILEKDHCILCINPWICYSLHTGIDFLHREFIMTYDHRADFFIITVQPAGKHFPCDQLCLFPVLRFCEKFLIKYCVILIHPALCCLFTGKFSHTLPIVLIGSRLCVLISHNTCINKSFFIITQGIIIIGKIHQKRLWQFSLIGGIHRLHIIFIQSGKPESSLNSQGKPAEIDSFSRISQHNITADRFQGIICRKSFITCCQGTVHAWTEVFLITGQVSEPHYKLLCKHFFFSCQEENLGPEAAHSV